MSLTLDDFSDQDLLAALERTANDEGWAAASEIASEIGLDDVQGTRSVAIRLGWMKRFGWMEHDEETKPGRWRLNEAGYSLVHPHKLTAATQRSLESLDDGQRAAVTAAVARELPRSSREGAHMTRRVWQHHMGSWRDRSIAPKRS